jgi:hypothetical protein
MSNPQNTMSKNSDRTSGFGLKPVAQLLRPVIKKVLPQKSVIFQQIFEIWPDIVNGTEAKGTIPEKLTFKMKEQKDGCLSIWAKSGSQATEISYNKSALIHRINSLFGFALVGDIKVMAHPTKTLVKTGPATPAKALKARGVSCQSLDKILGEISNPSLKAALGELGGFLDGETIETNNKGEDNA